jgi:hypothetical protein
MNAKFEFPEIIHINIIDSRTRLPVQNIIVLIHLMAFKNMDHFLLTPASDNQGNINISRRWLIEQIDTSASLIPLDYISGLDDLYPEIEVLTAKEDDVNKSIELMSNNQSYAENTAQIEELSNSVNHLYYHAKNSVVLNNENEIRVTLEVVEKTIGTVNEKPGVSG